MKAGWGSACVTPPLGVELCGYGYYLQRRCTGVRDDLYVRCLTLHAETEKFMILSADLIGLDAQTVEPLIPELGRRFGFAPEEIMLLCTHTHTGPATFVIEGCGVQDPGYVKALAGKFVEAAERAVADEDEVTALKTAHQAVEGIAYNRALEDGLVDNIVRGLRFERAARPPIALVSFACHPVARGKDVLVSADYPGEVCRLFEEKGVRAIFVNGLCGDIDPLTQRRGGHADRAAAVARYGAQIVDAFEASLTPQDGVRIKTACFTASIPLVPMSEEDLRRTRDAGEQPQVAAAWYAQMRRRMPLPARETFAVHALRVNDLVYCSMPYEAFTGVGDLVRAALPGLDAAVLGVSDAALGYLPADDDMGGGGSLGGYASNAAALLYLRPIIASGALEQAGREIGEKAAAALRFDGD